MRHVRKCNWFITSYYLKIASNDNSYLTHLGGAIKLPIEDIIHYLMMYKLA